MTRNEIAAGVLKNPFVLSAVLSSPKIQDGYPSRLEPFSGLVYVAKSSFNKEIFGTLHSTYYWAKCSQILLL